MESSEREIAAAVLRGAARSISEFGLRFDRVVLRVLGELRTVVEATAPLDMTFVITISAPIRAPAKTLTVLKQEIARVGAGVDDDIRTDIQGNAVRVCAIRHAPGRTPRLIGFVHDPASSSGVLVELARRWLHTQT